MGEMASNEIVNNALENSSSNIHNAIISLIFTTGLDKDTIRNIKINDLVKAAEMYFKDGESHTIEVLINKKDNDMCLCWTFENESKHQVIFSTPSTSKYIIRYLKQNEKYYDFNDLMNYFVQRTK